MNSKLLLTLFLIGLSPLFISSSFADWKDGPIQSGNFGDTPFERDFGDVDKVITIKDGKAFEDEEHSTMEITV